MSEPFFPSSLLPYQAVAARAPEGTLLVAEGARRVGLTFASADGAVSYASEARRDVYYFADGETDFLADCAAISSSRGISARTDGFLFNEGDEEIRVSCLTFPGGGRIFNLPPNPALLRGRQGRVIIDNAAFLPNLGELLKAALALLMWGGSTIVISAHNGADSEFNALIKDIRAGKRRGAVLRVPLKDAIAQGLYRHICLRTGQTWSAEAEAAWEAKLRAAFGDGAAEELDCIPKPVTTGGHNV